MTVESLENKRKRLIFRSEHRGTKEMDLLLGSFARKYVPDFSEDELSQYDEILKENDPDLYNWITGKNEAPANIMNPVFKRLMKHRYA
ncbi:MAG TPA: succinate dehydrogenase assembly factor 2 [Alphaproteobacteria bacterium]|nr:succinate dehydrogenase assembly factor 2 [Alphaproteobacteria bacterium]USO06545.1 MAG: succinate dehydrogenase assembly factor 2 [Rhodospirillales bacterium]HOO81962.1 succinate dehydrogenase assembly factor 2 [Alphaproteobacteria bacterium]